MSFDFNFISKGLTQYTSMSFSDVVSFGDRFIGANQNGLSTVFTHANDDGHPIQAEIETYITDFGFPNLKRFRHLYLAGKVEKLQITLKDDRGSEYSLPEINSDMVFKTLRLTAPRSMYAGKIALKIRNVDGSDFFLDKVWGLLVTRHAGHVYSS